MATFKLSILLALTAFLGSISAADQIADYSGNFGPSEEETAALAVPPTEDQIKADYITTAQIAQTAHTPPEGMGFLFPHTPGIPASVTRAENSVFTIVTPDGELVDAAVLMKGRTPEQAIAFLQSMSLSDNFRQTDRDIYILQLQNCIREHSKPCMIREGNSSATAFVTGDGKDLRTALHAVKAIAKLKGPLPILLVNSRGQIFPAAQLGARIASTYAGALDTDIGQKRNLDQVVIRLNVAIAPPLPVAKQPTHTGEKIYIVGFPIVTSDRHFFTAVDSDGKSLRVTRGTVLDLQETRERLLKSGTILDPSSELFTQSLTFTADGSPRMSGSPVLNSQGEVVSVYNAGLPQAGSAWPWRISYGTKQLLPAH